MGVRRWLVACAPNARLGLADAVTEVCGKDEQVELDFFDSAAELRRHLQGEAGALVAVGRLASDDVSDVNLAAALVHDGGARQVMLVPEHVSGSLMSRARQAGVNLVAELRAEGTFLYPLQGAVDVGGDNPADQEEVRPAAVPSPPVLVPGTRKRTLEEGVAPVIVFASGRGGVGKTTLVALTALQASAWGMRVAVVDLDLAQGNVRSVLGASRQGVLAVNDRELPSLDDILAEAQSSELGMPIVGPCERPEDSELVAPLVNGLLERLTHEVDLVLVDTSNTVTDAVADAMQAADRLLLVSDDMPGGLASLARVSGLAVRLGVARARIVRVVNRCDPKRPADLSEGRAEVGLEMARIHQIAEGNYDVAELGAQGAIAEVPKECRELSATVATCLARLLSELGRLPDVTEAQSALEGSFRKRHLPFLRRKREAS